jgi:cation:H+ antiporter
VVGAILTLGVSLGLLTAGAEVLVRGASGLAFRLRVSPLFVGLTVVAFGTSSPELASSLFAALHGNPDIAVGNVVGSNIFNVAVILGVAALVRPIVVSFAAIHRDVLVACAVATIPWLTMLEGGELSRWAGGVMVAGLLTYTYRAYRAGQHAPPDETRRAEVELGETVAVAAPPPGSAARGWLRDTALSLAGLLLLVLGARWFVEAAIDIARGLGLSDLVIGLTVVAAGTSMPELVTSIVAAVRGHSDIAVGNVLGSNIFNVLGVLGICALVAPQSVSPQVLVLDTPVMVAASLALLPIAKSGGRVSRGEGAFLLAGYAAYVGTLLSLARG